MAMLLQTKSLDFAGQTACDAITARVRRTCAALRDAIARRRQFEAKIHTIPVAWNGSAESPWVVPVTIVSRLDAQLEVPVRSDVANE